MKLEQGDAFEAQKAVWIRQHLPSYEQIWAAFIGHNGSGRALPMSGLSKEKEADREKFCQAHYSFAVDAYQLDQLVSSLRSNESEVMSLAKFLDYQQNLILAVALVGRIRDMFDTIAVAFHLRGKPFKDFQDLYAQRSNILHGPRLPVTLRDSQIEIPEIARENPVEGEWESKKSVWTSVPPNSFAPLTSFCQELRAEMFKTIVKNHQMIFHVAAAYFDDLRVNEMPSFKTLPVPTLIRLSVDPNISSDGIPPSGVANPTNPRRHRTTDGV